MQHSQGAPHRRQCHARPLNWYVRSSAQVELWHVSSLIVAFAEVYGYAPSDITILLDDQDPDHHVQPTKINIVRWKNFCDGPTLILFCFQVKSDG